MRPKIFVFTTAYYPFIGGAEIAIQEVARRLKDRFDFYIFTARLRRDLPKREERPEGIVIRLGFGNTLDKWLFPVFYVQHSVLNRLVQHRVLNILWAVDIGQASFTAAIFKLFRPKIPFIFTIQYGYGEERLKRGRLGLIGLAFRFILSRADYVTAISTYLLGLARGYGYKGPGEVIHNGVDLNNFSLRRHSEQGEESPSGSFTSFRMTKKGGTPVIITTSRLVPKNGIDTLINAIAGVKKEIPEVQCWILGDGLEGESLKFKVKSLKLDDNVKFFGSVPYDDVPKYLHEADIFVRPSRSEGMGNSFVEALAAGLPIIGTPVGGITDIIEDGETGLFAKVDDPKDLAEKIKTLLKDKKLAASIVENGSRMVEERFSWDKIANKYQTVFLRGLASYKYEAKPRRLNILIATPLFPPHLGGPALYAKRLGEEFSNIGHPAEVVSFSKFLRYLSGIRHLLYLAALSRHALRSDVVFSLDYTSVGLPAAVVSLIFRKPLVIRVEGDRLWEHFVERTRKDITLTQFYLNPPQPSFEKGGPRRRAYGTLRGRRGEISRKEKVIKELSGWVLRRASRLVFSSEWRRLMVTEAYGIPQEKTAIIRNVFPSANVIPSVSEGSTEILRFAQNDVEGRKRIILWAGRMLYLKNLHRLISAFQKVNNGSWELHLVGDGPEKESLKFKVKSFKFQDRVKFFEPMPHEGLLKKFQDSAIFALPSLSEVGPNVISDAVSAGTPFIMTKETGYIEYVGDAAVLIDPLDENDIAEKLRFLMDDKNREKQRAVILSKKAKNLRTLRGPSLTFRMTDRGWKEAAEEWIEIMQNAKIKMQN